MDLGLKDKVALITGAGSQIGFGHGIALALAQEGCDVIAADKDLAGAGETAAAVEALGRRALALQADVTDGASVGAMVKAALEKFGRIDILVNNAGRAGPRKPFVEKDEAEWDTDLDLNLRGVLICTRAVLPQMLARKSGRIINISAGAARLGGPNVSIYVTAKAGVIGFTRSLAREVIGEGVVVNSIAPGIGQTNFVSESKPGTVERFLSVTPSGKPTTPEDMGAMVAYLSSGAAANIVGQTIAIDGGLTMA